MITVAAVAAAIITGVITGAWYVRRLWSTIRADVHPCGCPTCRRMRREVIR